MEEENESIYEEYLKYHEKYKKIYGEKSLIFYQKGGFYQLYSIDNNIIDLKQISELTQIVITRINKKINRVDIKNPNMIGFPEHAIMKYIDILIEKNYTIVEIIQDPDKEKKDSNGRVLRYVNNIYSIGFKIDPTTNNNNYITNIYLENIKSKNNEILLCVGMSSIDLSTGEILIDEGNSTENNKLYGLTKIQRYLLLTNSTEIIIYENNNELTNDMKTLLNLENKNFKIMKDINNKIFQPNYQNELLSKVYKTCLNPIEYLNLENKNYGRNSLCLLLYYIEQRNILFIDKLNFPKNIENDDYLIVENDGLKQLNIFSEEKNKSLTCLYDIFKKNINTPIGYRYLKNRLLYPSINENELNEIYNTTEIIINNNYFYDLDDYLSKINDIERLHRKLLLNLLNPNELINLIENYIMITKLITFIKSSKINICLSDIIINNMKEMIEEIEKLYDFELMETQTIKNITQSFFKENIYPNIDLLKKSSSSSLDLLNNLANELSTLINGKVNIKKLNNNNYCLSLTKIRSKKLQEIFKTKIEILGFKTNDFIFSSDTNNNDKIDHNLFKIMTEDIKESDNELIKLVKEKYLENLLYLTKKFNKKYKSNNTFFNKIVEFIGILDYLNCNAKTAKFNNYIKPQIINNNNDESYFESQKLRHPIIEQLINYEFIPNDIIIGKNDNKIISITGFNSGGKTSLIRSVASNIILAQAGLFCSASEIKYYPYKNMFVDIDKSDNLFKGLSTFTTEICNINNIINKATKNSIVISDESITGTEFNSTISILSALIIYLSQKNISFLFCTHTYEIFNLQKIKDLLNLKIYHLTVEIINNKIIYNRILKYGLDPIKNYGVMVSNKLIFNNDFNDMVFDIHKELINEYNITDIKTSHFNSNKIIYECEICHDKTINNLEVHHIQYQELYEKKLLNKTHIKKNQLSNLATVCQLCHDKIHNNQIIINKYNMTSEGKELNITYYK